MLINGNLQGNIRRGGKMLANYPGIVAAPPKNVTNAQNKHNRVCSTVPLLRADFVHCADDDIIRAAGKLIRFARNAPNSPGACAFLYYDKI
jgi:hypothetical protein